MKNAAEVMGLGPKFQSSIENCECKYKSLVTLLKSELSALELRKLIYVLSHDVRYSIINKLFLKTNINHLFALFILNSDNINEKDKQYLCREIVEHIDSE
jgi:hypothetical protein